MLSSMRDHQATLMDAQRFYYNNYEYYNSFEDMEQDYRNDLSKLRFNLKRKSQASIILYDSHTSNYNDLPMQRLLKDHIPKHYSYNHLIDEQHKTIDDLLYKFTLSYHQQNYSDIKNDREDEKDNFKIIILKYMFQLFNQKFADQEEQDFAYMSQILEQFKKVGQETKAKVELLYEKQGRSENNEFMERWFAFEQYWAFLIEHKLQAQNKHKKIQNFYLFQFCVYTKYIMQQIASGQMRNILLFAQPFTPELSYNIHPLMIPLCFTHQAKQQDAPRILFLNLDGRQTYFNLRSAGLLPDNIRYISIFREPIGSQIVETKIDNVCQDFQVDVEYKNMNKAHSELLFKEIRPFDLNGNQVSTKSNIILYPLNSIYLRNLFSTMNASKKLQQRKIPVLQPYNDIKWLWQQIIASQVQQWNPQIVIVSYNGMMNIKQQDFQLIMKDLTILCDHRIILYTNMSGLVKEAQEQMQVQLDQQKYPINRIKCVKEFMMKYIPYSYDQVDEQRYFNNLSSFIKISSGAVSMKRQVKSSPINRYLLGQRLLYLECLSQFKEYQNILCTNNTGASIERLFKSFAANELRQNRKENEWWQKKIQQVQKQLLDYNEQDVLQSESDYQKREIAYKIKQIKMEFEVEELLIHGQQGCMDIGNEFVSFLKRGKQKLMLTNLQSYHYRKFYTGEEEDRGGRLKCYRFCLNQIDNEQILLQRYSQIIFDEKKVRIFIVNYKISEEGHIILHGENQQRGGFIRMRRVQSKIEETLNNLNLENLGNETIRLNYSHCFLREKLYLFWPQEWDTRQQIRRKLLGLQYYPPHVSYMLRVHYNQNDKIYNMEQLKFKDKNSIPIVPRRGCTSIELNQNKFYIFGGIYDSRLDFYVHSPPINIATIQDDTFSIDTLPKRKEKYDKRNSNLKPKMNYRIQRIIKNGDDGGNILLGGGYGRHFTNYHSLLSYENYVIANEYEGPKMTKLEIKSFRLVKLNRPLISSEIGRYIVVGGQNEYQERFSEEIKDWMIGQGKEQRTGQRDINTILDEEMRVKQFKIDHKRNYLFGWDRTIRQRIYVPHCWSPELQIISGGHLYLIYAALKTQKSINYNIGNFLIPKEQDLISLCLDEDRLLVLSNSPILNNLDNRPSNYILYQGSLANMNDLLNRRELLLQERYEFKGSPFHISLQCKTIFILDDKIYLLGGVRRSNTAIYQREDYVLQRNKDKLKRRVRKLESTDDTLELHSPIVIKYQDGFLLYSIVSEQKVLSTNDNKAIRQDFWKLKIETFTPNDGCQQETLLSGPIYLCHLDFQKCIKVNRKPSFEDPKFIKIIPYTKFQSGLLREYLQKIYIKVNKLQEERFSEYLKLFKMIIQQRDDAKISELLYQHHHRGKTFKQFISMFDFLLDQEKRQRQSLENQELIRDLRSLYSLLNKHFIQCILKLDNDDSQLYRFIIEDRSSRKVKYIAIGPLFSLKLRFLRIRFKHELSICLNQVNQEELFFNTNILGCEEITKERIKGANIDWQQEGLMKKIAVSYKF